MRHPVTAGMFAALLIVLLVMAGCTPPQSQPAIAAPATATGVPVVLAPVETATLPPTEIPASATPLPEPTALPTDLPTETPTAIPPTATVAPTPTPACAGPLSPTAANAEGPYYTPGAPFRATLYEPGMPGARLVITGRVLTADCEPVAGAVLDFWQADANGVYDNAGFTLRGKQETAEDGSYRLETVLPGEYPGRPPHIHVKVNAPGGSALTTQIYFAGMAGNAADGLIQPSLITTLTTEDDGSVSAPFDFVLPQ